MTSSTCDISFYGNILERTARSEICGKIAKQMKETSPLSAQGDIAYLAWFGNWGVFSCYEHGF